MLTRNGSVFEAELADVIPICRCSIAGTRIIGRLTAGYVLNVEQRARMNTHEEEANDGIAEIERVS
jgi:hypothetical protein